jgi:hypothetical protein
MKDVGKDKVVRTKDKARGKREMTKSGLGTFHFLLSI